MIVKKAGKRNRRGKVDSMGQRVDFRFKILDCRLETGKTGSTEIGRKAYGEDEPL